MTITEGIGYNESGRDNNNNELIVIGKESSNVISHINQTEK